MKRQKVYLLAFFLSIIFLNGCKEEENILQVQFEQEGDPFAIVDSVKYESERMSFSDGDKLFSEYIEKSLSENNFQLASHFKVIQVFQELIRNRSGETLANLERVHKYALEHGTIETIIYSNKALADYHSRYGDITVALNYINAAEELLPQTEDLHYHTMVKGTKAQVLKDANQRPEAYELFVESAELMYELGQWNNYSVIHNSMGLLLLEMDLPEDALEAFTIAHKMNREYGYLRDLFATYNNISLALEALDQYDKAIDTLRVAVELGLEHDHFHGVAQNYYNMGNIYNKIGDFDSALVYFERGLELSNQIGFDFGIMYNSFGKSMALNSLGQYQESLEHSKLALSYADRFNIETLQSDINQELYRAYYNTGMLAEALDSYIKHAELSKQLNEELRGKELQEIHIRYSVREKEALNQLLLQQVEYQETINANQKLVLALFGIIIILLVSARFVIYRKQNFLKKSLNTIEEQKNNLFVRNQKIEKLNTERQALMGVIVHDLKNPIAIISGFLELIEDEYVSDSNKKYLSHINQANTRMKSLVTSLLDIHELENKEVTKEFTTENLTDSLNSIMLYFNGKAIDKNLSFSCQIENLTVQTNFAYLKRIIENLVSNAIKFSFPGGKVEVFLRVDSANMLHLSVIDEGPGFTEKDLESAFKMLTTLSARPTANEDSDGIGLYTVKLLVNKLEGNIYIENNAEKGATIHCNIPVKVVEEPLKKESLVNV